MAKDQQVRDIQKKRFFQQGQGQRNIPKVLQKFSILFISHSQTVENLKKFRYRTNSYMDISILSPNAHTPARHRYPDSNNHTINGEPEHAALIRLKGKAPWMNNVTQKYEPFREIL